MHIIIHVIFARLKITNKVILIMVTNPFLISLIASFITFSLVLRKQMGLGAISPDVQAKLYRIRIRGLRMYPLTT